MGLFKFSTLRDEAQVGRRVQAIVQSVVSSSIKLSLDTAGKE